MKKALLAGAAVATPLKTDTSIDLDALVMHCKHLLTRGLDTLVLFGSTGEGSSFTHDERLRAIVRLSEAGVGPKQLGTGIFALSSQEAGVQAKDAFAAGCGQVLLAPPSYFKGVDDEGLFRWFADAVESAGSEPGEIVLYHIPGMTQVELGVALVSRLAERFPDVVVGVKDSSGNWPYTQQLLKECDALKIFVGHEGYLAQGLKHGAVGTISGSANFIPDVIHSVVHDQVAPANLPMLIDEMLKMPIIPAVKSLIAHRLKNPDWAIVKPPLSSLTDNQAVVIGQHLDRLFPE